MFIKNKIAALLLIFLLTFNVCAAEEYKITNTPPSDIQAVETTQSSNIPIMQKCTQERISSKNLTARCLI